MGRLAKKQKTVSNGQNNSLFYFFAGFLLLFLPIFHLPAAMDEAMQPRLLAVGILTVLLGFFLLKASAYKKLNTSALHHPIFILLIAYYCVTVLSLFFAVNYKQGFYELSKTGMTLIIVCLAVLIFEKVENWSQKLSKLVIVSASIALLTGLYQYIMHVVMATTEKLPDGLELIYAVKGLMFHKNEFTTSLLLLLPFTVYGALVLKLNWRLASRIITVLLLLMIILLKTRSVWIGVGLGLVAVIILLVLFYKQFGISARMRKIIFISLLAGTGLLTILFSIPKPVNEQSFFGRLRSITDPNSNDNIHRLKIWGSTYKMIKKHPLTGVGAGNWSIKAPAFFKGKFQLPEQLNWTRPHNDYLWICSEKGIPGLLIYLAIFAAILYNLFMTIKKSHLPEYRLLALIFLGTTIAYMGVAVFNMPYERTEHQVIIAIIAAASVLMYQSVCPAKTLSVNRFTLLIPMILISGFTMVYGFAAVLHESHVRKAIDAQNQQNWEEVIRQAELGKNNLTSLDPMSFPVEYYKGLAYARLNRHQEAVDVLKEALTLSPHNFWIINQMGQSYYNLGMFNKAQKCVEKVLRIIPTYKEGLKSLSAIYFQKKRYGKAYLTLKKYQDGSRIPKSAET
jgi:O-antigen ligase